MQRLLAGKRAKAERGELGMQVPMGYTRRPSGEVIKELALVLHQPLLLGGDR